MYDVSIPTVNPVSYEIVVIKKVEELSTVIVDAKRTGTFSFDYETAPSKNTRNEYEERSKSYLKTLQTLQSEYEVHKQMNKTAAGAKKALSVLNSRSKEVTAEYEDFCKWYRESVFDPYRGEVVCISMCCEVSKVYLMFFDNQEQCIAALQVIADNIFADEEICKIAYNLEFETLFSLKYGHYIIGSVYDPLVAVARITQVLWPEQIIDAKRPAHGLGLKPTAARYLGHKMIEFDELLTKYKADFFDKLDYNNPDVQRYAAEDAVCSLMLAMFWVEVSAQIPIEPSTDGLIRPYNNYHEWLSEIEMPFMKVVGEMRYHGITWNEAMCIEVYETALAKQEETSQRIKEISNQLCVKLVEAGMPKEAVINYYNMEIGKTGKTKVVREFLFDVLNVPVAKESDKTGNASLDGEALLDMIFMVEHKLKDINEEKLLSVELPEVVENIRKLTSAQIKAYDVRSREPLFEQELVLELLNCILDMQKYSVLISSHIEGRKKYVHPITGRIHSSYTIWTETSRTNSQRPNGQNVPRPDNDIFEIRGLYQPAKGKVLILADQAGFELRLMAWQSNDETMQNLLNNGEDLHMATAMEMTHKPKEQVSKHERSLAKAGNFGINYGGTEHSLQKTLKKLGVRASLPECKLIVDAIKRKYPGIPQFQQDVARRAAKNGFVDTIFGYKRLLPFINSYQRGLRSSDERRAANTPIQGSAADIMKWSQIRLYDYIGKNKLHNKLNMIAQIHDEIMFEVDDNVEDIQKFVKVIREIMETPPIENFPVKLVADISIAKERWSRKMDVDKYIASLK